MIDMVVDEKKDIRYLVNYSGIHKLFQNFIYF